MEMLLSLLFINFFPKKMSVWVVERRLTCLRSKMPDRKLLDELVGCPLLADDDYEVIDVAENGKLMAYPDTAISFQ